MPVILELTPTGSGRLSSAVVHRAGIYRAVIRHVDARGSNNPSSVWRAPSRRPTMPRGHTWTSDPAGRSVRASAKHFRKFQREGAWAAIWVELLFALREQAGRGSLTAANIDSQSVKLAEKAAVETWVKTTQWVTTSDRRSKEASSTDLPAFFGPRLA
jgi:hypothetical protein